MSAAESSLVITLQRRRRDDSRLFQSVALIPFVVDMPAEVVVGEEELEEGVVPVQFCD